MKRIIMHWTAGTHLVGAQDALHYHFIVDGGGAVVAGKYAPEDNLDVSNGEYAAHTRNCNTGSIGVAVAAMGRARERPFSAGPWPITEPQLEAFLRAVAGLADTYRIPTQRDTILTHAEVERTLGIDQAGKWDITWLPGMDAPGAALDVGDRLRARIQEIRAAGRAGGDSASAAMAKGLRALVAEKAETRKALTDLHEGASAIARAATRLRLSLDQEVQTLLRLASELDQT